MPYSASARSLTETVSLRSRPMPATVGPVRYRSRRGLAQLGRALLGFLLRLQGFLLCMTGLLRCRLGLIQELAHVLAICLQRLGFLFPNLVISPTRLDGPNRFHFSLAYAEALPVQIHRRAAVTRDHLAQIADAAGIGAHSDLGVFLHKSDDLFLRPSLDDRHSEVAGNGLAAGVEDVQIRPDADDHGQDRLRAAELRADRMIRSPSR